MWFRYCKNNNWTLVCFNFFDDFCYKFIKSNYYEMWFFLKMCAYFHECLPETIPKVYLMHQQFWYPLPITFWTYQPMVACTHPSVLICDLPNIIKARNINVFCNHTWWNVMFNKLFCTWAIISNLCLIKKEIHIIYN